MRPDIRGDNKHSISKVSGWAISHQKMGRAHQVRRRQQVQGLRSIHTPRSANPTPRSLHAPSEQLSGRKYPEASLRIVHDPPQLRWYPAEIMIVSRSSLRQAAGPDSDKLGLPIISPKNLRMLETMKTFSHHLHQPRRQQWVVITRVWKPHGAAER